MLPALEWMRSHYICYLLSTSLLSSAWASWESSLCHLWGITVCAQTCRKHRLAGLLTLLVCMEEEGALRWCDDMPHMNFSLRCLFSWSKPFIFTKCLEMGCFALFDGSWAFSFGKMWNTSSLLEERGDALKCLEWIQAGAAESVSRSFCRHILFNAAFVTLNWQGIYL